MKNYFNYNFDVNLNYEKQIQGYRYLCHSHKKINEIALRIKYILCTLIVLQ